MRKCFANEKLVEYEKLAEICTIHIETKLKIGKCVANEKWVETGNESIEKTFH